MRIQEVIKRDGPHCVWCSARLSADHPDATVDHALPYAKDGSNRVENLLLACDACNGERGTTPLDQFARKMREQGYVVRRRAIARANERIAQDPTCRRSVCAAASGLRLEPVVRSTRRRSRRSTPAPVTVLSTRTAKSPTQTKTKQTATPRRDLAQRTRAGLGAGLAAAARLRPRIELVEELVWAQAA